MLKLGYADTPEGQVHYVTDGKGEPLLLLHQGPRSSRMYVDIIPLLAGRYRVIAMDMLGHGNSATPPPDGGVEYLARNVVHVLDALRIERCHLFGLHTGSAIAVEVAAAAPARIGSLTLFGFPLVENEAEQKDYFDTTAKNPLPLDTATDGSHLVRVWMRAYSEVQRLWLHTAHPPSAELHPHPLRSVHAFMTEKHLQFLDRWVLDFLQWRRSLGKIQRALFTYDFKSRLPLIKAPTLHIEPDSPYENYFCRRGAQVAKIIPKCEAVVLPGSDDQAAEFKEKELAAMMVSFLRKHPL